MNGSVFLDTNVLIYAAVAGDSRTVAAEALLAEGGVVSVQVLNEFVAVARRKLGMTWDDVEAALAALQVLCPEPVPITMETHEVALRIARDQGYNIYDALIAAAALLAGCETLYSEDYQAGQVLEGKLRIVNPFV